MLATLYMTVSMRPEPNTLTLRSFTPAVGKTSLSSKEIEPAVVYSSSADSPTKALFSANASFDARNAGSPNAMNTVAGSEKKNAV